LIQDVKSEVEKLKSDLKTKDDMCNKLKTVAVKTKKELADFKTKVNIKTKIKNIHHPITRVCTCATRPIKA
jgi:hypothetical protein